MRAFQLTDYAGPTGLTPTEISPPSPGDGEILVGVEAIGINYPDLAMIKGSYQNKPDLPMVPGCEVAGTVLAVAPGSPWAVGDRVAAFTWSGGFAEQAVVRSDSAVRIPPGTSAAHAAAMVVNYHTSYFALARRGRVQAGETVLVLGAGGGIGTAALQIGHGLGARVIAGVSSTERVRVALDAGASEAIVLTHGFSEQVRSLTDGRGVDVVLDPVGDWLFGEALRALAPEGRILVVGFAAGAIPEVKVNRLLLRNVDVVGVAFGAFLDVDTTLMAEQADALDRMVADGVVDPQIDKHYSFDEIPIALGDLEGGRIRGKAVVIL